MKYVGSAWIHCRGEVFSFCLSLQILPICFFLSATLHATCSSYSTAFTDFQQILQPIISQYNETKLSLSLFRTSTVMEENNCDEQGTKFETRPNVNTVLQGGFEDLFDEFCTPDLDNTDFTTAFYDETQALFMSSDLSGNTSGISNSSDSCFDIDIDPLRYGIPPESKAFSKETRTEPPFSFDTLTPQVLSRTFRHAGSERPTIFVTPTQITLNPPQIKPEVIHTTSCSLLDLSIQSMEEKPDSDSGLKPRKERRVSPKQSKRPKTCPYSTPPPSEDDIPTSPSRRNGHIAGYNRKTGELTLVGLYPPRFHHGVYTCPDEKCREINGKDTHWTTKNGYKYHLMNCCLQNPDSERSKKLREGGLDLKPVKNGFSKECVCGAHFKSENGFKLHQDSNMSTKDGRCVEKARRKENRSPNSVPIAGNSNMGIDVGMFYEPDGARYLFDGNQYVQIGDDSAMYVNNN